MDKADTKLIEIAAIGGIAYFILKQLGDMGKGVQEAITGAVSSAPSVITGAVDSIFQTPTGPAPSQYQPILSALGPVGSLLPADTITSIESILQTPTGPAPSPYQPILSALGPIGSFIGSIGSLIPTATAPTIAEAPPEAFDRPEFPVNEGWVSYWRGDPYYTWAYKMVDYNSYELQSGEKWGQCAEGGYGCSTNKDAVIMGLV